MNEELLKETGKNVKTRRKALTGIGILSVFSLLKLIFFGKKNDAISCAPSVQPTTVKMLSQDGKLVEVDIAYLGKSPQKISDKELQEWIKK